MNRPDSRASAARQRAISPATFTTRSSSSMRSGRHLENLGRPPVLDGLLRASRKKDVPKPAVFQEFERDVEQNDLQLARFDFLKMSCSFDGALVGPPDTTPPRGGATAIEMIFNQYAARRQPDEMETVVKITFEDTAAHNKTMDFPELDKFMEDFFPGTFSRKEIKWLFKQANSMNGISDDNVFVLQLDEFICLLCQVGCQLCRGGTPRQIAKHVGKVMGLNDPKAMRVRLIELARHNAAFGAWKSEEAWKTRAFDPKTRTKLEKDAEKFIPPAAELKELKEAMTNGFPKVLIAEWNPFDGRYIAMALPLEGVRQGKPARFRVRVSNIASRAFQLAARIENLPCLSMKYTPPKPIAPGMEMTIELVMEHVVPGESLGAIIFSTEEMGVPIFLCPVYFRVPHDSLSTLADETLQVIAHKYGSEALNDAFSKEDSQGSGKIPVVKIQEVLVGGLGLHMTDDRLHACLQSCEQDADGLVAYSEWVDSVQRRYDALDHVQKGSLTSSRLRVKMDPLEQNIVTFGYGIKLQASLANLIIPEYASSREGSPDQHRGDSSLRSPMGRKSGGSRTPQSMFSRPFTPSAEKVF